MLDLAMSVHVACFTWWVQPEPFAAPQQDVEIVMEIMVQTAAGPCTWHQLHVLIGSFVMIGNTLKEHLYTGTKSALHQTMPACSTSVIDCCDPFETDLLFTQLVHTTAEHWAVSSNEIGAPCAALKKIHSLLLLVFLCVY